MGALRIGQGEPQQDGVYGIMRNYILRVLYKERDPLAFLLIILFGLFFAWVETATQEAPARALRPEVSVPIGKCFENINRCFNGQRWVYRYELQGER